MVLALFFIANAIGFNSEAVQLQLTTPGSDDTPGIDAFKPILHLSNAVMEYVIIGRTV